MSAPYYDGLWLVAREDLRNLLDLDRRLQSGPPATDKDLALNAALTAYLKYRNLVKGLITCYDQTVQSQKREFVKSVLDCAIGRMLEYKRAIVNLDFSLYQWPDHIMIQLKFTPDDVDILAPGSNKEIFEERRKYIQELLDTANRPPQEILEESLSQIHIESTARGVEAESKSRLRRRKSKVEPTSTIMIPQESIQERAAREARLAVERKMQSAMLLIQSHERARKGRCSAADAQKMYNYKQKVSMGLLRPKKFDEVKYTRAVVIIQRAWRRYAVKKSKRKRIQRLEELLGMTIPSWKSEEESQKDAQRYKKRIERMLKYRELKDEATSDERARLLKFRAPDLADSIVDEIREWFLQWYRVVGHFDLYPAAHLGGSVLIATGQTLTPQEYLTAKNAKQKGKAETKSKEEANEESEEPEMDEAFKWNMPRTKTFDLLVSANDDYVKNWSFRIENGKPEQKVYLDPITEQLCYELQLEVRQMVDELMRQELEVFNKALIKDCTKDKEKLVFLMERKKEQKKLDKVKKEKKKKKNRLDDISDEDLFNELVQAKIIRNYPLASLQAWIGDLSYQNYEASIEFRDYKYRLGEVKQAIIEYCILPLISKEVHQIAPLTRSVCIYGLPRSGKTLLANAICSEVGAMLFDLTPHVLIGKYLGKKNQQKLVDMISRVARAYAPSIIFLDGGEKPWLKKVPPEERFTQPKRFARYYPKLVKSIKPGDQILFLTISSEPYKAGRPFIKIHDKFIMIPLTDYNTLYMYYKDLLMKYHGVDRDIDVSCLAENSVGVPLEYIRYAVEKVLNVRRRIRLKFEPLRPLEIMEEILNYEPPSEKQLSQLESFETRTPLGKKRKQMMEEEKAHRDKLAGIKDKRKKQ